MDLFKKVKVFAPATIANVGPGLDVLGIAIEQPGDVVIAKRRPEKGFMFALQDSLFDIPANQNNVAAHVANFMLDELDPPFGISMILEKKMPISSGLGSSGASSAAAALAVNALLPKPLSKMELIRFAIEGEKLASGTGHADNVAPSLLGGACLIRSYCPLDVIQLPVNNVLFWIVAHPHMLIKTQDARDILPTSIPLSTVITQSGHLGGLITGLMLGDGTLVGKSLTDLIAEPLRGKLIPGFAAVKDAAINAGALGFSISGSGPSVFAVATSLVIAEAVGEKMKSTFLQVANMECDIYISPINLAGATILEQS